MEALFQTSSGIAPPPAVFRSASDFSLIDCFVVYRITARHLTTMHCVFSRSLAFARAVSVWTWDRGRVGFFDSRRFRSAESAHFDPKP